MSGHSSEVIGVFSNRFKLDSKSIKVFVKTVRTEFKSERGLFKNVWGQFKSDQGIFENDRTEGETCIPFLVFLFFEFEWRRVLFS